MNDASITVSTVGADETIFECTPIKMYELVELMICNPGTGATTVEIADVFTTEDGTNIRDVKFKESVSGSLNLRVQGIIFRGKAVVNAGAAGIVVSMGLEEV